MGGPIGEEQRGLTKEHVDKDFTQAVEYDAEEYRASANGRVEGEANA